MQGFFTPLDSETTMKYHTENSKTACKQASKKINNFVSDMVHNFSTNSTNSDEEAFDVVRTIAYELAEASTEVYLAMSMNSVSTGEENIKTMDREKIHKAVEMTLDAILTDAKDVIKRTTGVGLNTEIVECSREQMAGYKASKNAVKH
jgi:hypothetical protein